MLTRSEVIIKNMRKGTDWVRRTAAIFCYKRCWRVSKSLLSRLVEVYRFTPEPDRYGTKLLPEH